MTILPDDLIDPAELQLLRRVRDLAERAVVPFDPVAISATVAATRRRRFGPFTRFGMVLAGAAAVAVVVGVSGMFIGRGPLGPGSVGPTASPQLAETYCTPYDVDAVITGWDGAAGHRIATVELRQIGTSPCSVDPLPQPWLADGHGSHLIDGMAGGGAPILIAPGDVLSTLVDVDNYCGPDPDAPVTVAFTQGDSSNNQLPRNAALYVATALTPQDLSGVPPCLGPGSPARIEMHPWAR
jgi:hypothetical protein